MDEGRQCDERRRDAEASQLEVMQQPVGENKRQMGGRRWRLRVERQRHSKNGTTRADATTSQGKQEGSAKVSLTQCRVNKGKVLGKAARVAGS